MKCEEITFYKQKRDINYLCKDYLEKLNKILNLKYIYFLFYANTRSLTDWDYREIIWFRLIFIFNYFLLRGRIYQSDGIGNNFTVRMKDRKTCHYLCDSSIYHVVASMCRKYINYMWIIIQYDICLERPCYSENDVQRVRAN